MFHKYMFTTGQTGDQEADHHGAEGPARLQLALHRRFLRRISQVNKTNGFGTKLMVLGLKTVENVKFALLQRRRDQHLHGVHGRRFAGPDPEEDGQDTGEVLQSHHLCRQCIKPLNLLPLLSQVLYFMTLSRFFAA